MDKQIEGIIEYDVGYTTSSTNKRKKKSQCIIWIIVWIVIIFVIIGLAILRFSGRGGFVIIILPLPAYMLYKTIKLYQSLK